MDILENQKIDPSLEPLLNPLLLELMGEKECIGVILHGSYARGTAHSQSDVDILCVTSADWFSKEIRRIDGKEVEIQIFPIEKIQRDFQKGMPFMIFAFLGAIILEDTDSQISQLCEKAREIWKKGPKEAKKIEILLGKSFLRHRLEEIDRLSKNPDDQGTLKLFCFLTFQAVLEAFQRLRGYWKDKTAHFMKDLPQKDPVFWEKCSKFLNSEENSERVETLKELVEYALEPVGGISDVEYKTPRIPAKSDYLIAPIFFR